MLEIVGPRLANMGEVVTLVCRYDLEKDAVYSIKWYKDQHEIYRYVPTDQPEVYAFRIKDVHVDVRRQTITIVMCAAAASYGKNPRT